MTLFSAILLHISLAITISLATFNTFPTLLFGNIISVWDMAGEIVFVFVFEFEFVSPFFDARLTVTFPLLLGFFLLAAPLFFRFVSAAAYKSSLSSSSSDPELSP